ncbi:hypothetical protein [Roseomonas populi]|uniref:MarR family transcriptional regulator n=1 Tax=Roseomonas populi TaxID=3121582 RepID=A0ABT1X6Y6_9PROT|nr:hypothetical protein [Roseomonas pecuniae]MCR0983861.1 hypothetical protein [Roseomonas pecuniae]
MTPPGPSDPLLQKAAQLASHPDFPQAVHAYSVGLARLREAPRFVNIIASTDLRWRIVGFLLYLDADRERFGPEGGATYGRLLDLSTRQGDATPRTVQSLLALLQFSGLVRRTASQADRRVKYYRPTDRMDAFVRAWLRYGTAALDILEPEMQRGRLVENRAFVDAFSVSGGRAHLEDVVPLADRVPAPLSSLKAMLGSYSVILAVLLAHFEDVPTPSRRSIAGRFGLSRSQVDLVVQAGRDKGLFTIDTNANLIPTPALEDSFHRWISIELAFYASHMRP